MLDSEPAQHFLGESFTHEQFDAQGCPALIHEFFLNKLLRHPSTDDSD